MTEISCHKVIITRTYKMELNIFRNTSQYLILVTLCQITSASFRFISFKYLFTLYFYNKIPPITARESASLKTILQMSGPISPENQGLVGAALIAYSGLVIGGAYYLSNRDTSTPTKKTDSASHRTVPPLIHHSLPDSAPSNTNNLSI